MLPPSNITGNLVKEVSFDDGKGSGGAITDNVNIRTITLEKDEHVEHIHIGFTQRSDASTQKPQLVAPYFNVNVQENPYTMSFTMHGVRAFDARDFTALQKSDLVEDAYWVMTHDDSAWRFVIVFNSPVHYQIHEYADPAEVVVSILPLPFEEKNDPFYTIRTDAYPLGHELGNMEERVYEEEGIRYLRESGDPFNTEESSFYMELGTYETIEEAEAKLASFQTIFEHDFPVFIEEK
ncbi:hypothetical protein NCCP2222_25510 [Sporosarcina sp. NCCP-2222]|nr:hypothetical protein NCCP2222_25510 [Sporosarcina sp. NCCP-2222]